MLGHNCRLANKRISMVTCCSLLYRAHDHSDGHRRMREGGGGVRGGRGHWPSEGNYFENLTGSQDLPPPPTYTIEMI